MPEPPVPATQAAPLLPVAPLASDRFLAAIVASSDDAIIGKTLDGTITSWNPAAERLYGYTADEAIGQPISLIIPDDRPDELPSIMARLRNCQRIDHFETVRVRKDGTRLDVSVSISPIYDDRGDIVGAASVGRDITERVQAVREREDLARQANEATRQREAVLHDTNAALEIINRVGHLLAAELDLERLIQAVTDAATTLTGAQFGAFFYNALDARGEHYTLYAIAGVPREAFSQFPLPRNTAMFGPTFRGEGTVRIADVRSDPRFGQNAPYFGLPEGHLPVVSYLAVPVIGHDETVLGGLFFGHHERDVFDARAERLAEGLAGQAAVAVENARLFQQVQRELAARTESEDRFWAVWEATSEALALSDPEGIVLAVNPAYCALYGLSAHEYIGQSFARIFAEDARAEAEAQYRAVFTNPDAPHTYEARVQRPDGTERIVEVRADFLVRDGQRVAMVSAIRDITERKQIEAEREAFVDAAAHDLKNPLTTILGQVQLLRRRADREQVVEPERLASGLVAIEGAASRMSALIEEMMDAAHLSAGRRLELRLAPVDVLALVTSAVEEARRGASGRVIRVETEAAELVGMWDAERLARVLANLLSNAVKYSLADTEVVVQVEQDVTPNGAAWAIVAVRDEGVGIPAADLPCVFERFYRGANVTGRTHGTGIGLAGARQIVAQHGGTILVESVEGRGSTFIVRLPLVATGAAPGS